MGYVCVGVRCCVGVCMPCGVCVCWGLCAVLGYVCHVGCVCVGVCVLCGYVYMLGTCAMWTVSTDTSVSWPEQREEHLGRSLLMGPAWPPDSQPCSAEQLTLAFPLSFLASLLILLCLLPQAVVTVAFAVSVYGQCSREAPVRTVQSQALEVGLLLSLVHMPPPVWFWLLSVFQLLSWGGVSQSAIFFLVH